MGGRSPLSRSRRRLGDYPGRRDVSGVAYTWVRRQVALGPRPAGSAENLPGFVGANDGASGVAVVLELARVVRERRVRPTIVFALFDGEESPSNEPGDDFYEHGLRGSKVIRLVVSEWVMP